MTAPDDVQREQEPQYDEGEHEDKDEAQQPAEEIPYRRIEGCVRRAAEPAHRSERDRRPSPAR